MNLASRALTLPAFLPLLMSLAIASAAAEPSSKALPGLASGSDLGGPLALGSGIPDPRSPALMPPKAGPGYRGLFVVVLPWDADRHLIEAHRRLEFALRLDEPKEPALRVTVRF